MKHPAHAEGMLAYRKGATNCPYPSYRAPIAREAWQQGYRLAQQRERTQPHQELGSATQACHREQQLPLDLNGSHQCND